MARTSLQGRTFDVRLYMDVRKGVQVRFRCHSVYPLEIRKNLFYKRWDCGVFATVELVMAEARKAEARLNAS
jgi:hypothetical protein